MKQDTKNGLKLVSVNVDQMQAFVIINVGTMINDLHRECKKLIDKILRDKGSI